MIERTDVPSQVSPKTDSSSVEARIHSLTWSKSSYSNLDKGIRFAVRVLHARGIETCQSCQGGVGHAYSEPTVDLVAASDDALGFAALSALQSYGLPVSCVSIVWPVRHGLPFEKLWRITFFKTMEDRADEVPMFVYGYRATGGADE